MEIEKKNTKNRKKQELKIRRLKNTKELRLVINILMMMMELIRYQLDGNGEMLMATTGLVAEIHVESIYRRLFLWF